MATVTISSIAVCIFKEDIFSRDILCPILPVSYTHLYRPRFNNGEGGDRPQRPSYNREGGDRPYRPRFNNGEGGGYRDVYKRQGYFSATFASRSNSSGYFFLK